MPARYRRRPVRRRARVSRRCRKRPAKRSRRGRSVPSPVIRFASERAWNPTDAAEGPVALWKAFSFQLGDLPGLADYQRMYTQFRVLKARLCITCTSGGDNGQRGPCSYLVAGSRSVVATAGVPGSLPVEALRENRWCRVRQPSPATGGISVGFYPYTLVSVFQTCSSGAQVPAQRPREARLWTPFSWAGAGRDSTVYWGPYLAVKDAGAVRNWTALCSLQVWFQFRGRR